MNTTPYYSYKDVKLSTKEYKDMKKVRLWNDIQPDNTLKLKSSKIYDMANNTIERKSETTFSRIPMVNSATKDKLLDFVVEDGRFFLQGKMRNGEIEHISSLKYYPIEPKHYKKLGNLALRFCNKVERFLHR